LAGSDDEFFTLWLQVSKLVQNLLSKDINNKILPFEKGEGFIIQENYQKVKKRTPLTETNFNKGLAKANSSFNN